MIITHLRKLNLIKSVSVISLQSLAKIQKEITKKRIKRLTKSDRCGEAVIILRGYETYL